MATLGIFSVKKVTFHEGIYYTYGGFGIYLKEIMKYFDRTILVCHVSNGIPPSKGYYSISSDKLKVIHLPQSRSEIGVFIKMPFVFYNAHKYIKEMDVVHARMPNYTGVIGAFFSRIYKKPLFCQIIADWYIEAKKTPPMKKYGLGILLKMDYYLYDFLERRVCNKQLVFSQGISCHTKHKKNSNSHLILSSSHRLADIIPLRDTFTFNSYNILTVGRLTGIKNQELLLNALSILNNDNKKWKLNIVGSGPRLLYLKKLAESLGVIDEVRFHGQLDHGEELWNVYDKCDVFVLPSKSEGTPKVLLEAMARSLPIIASNVGGIPTSVIHNQTGLLFGDGDVKGLVENLNLISKDTDLREYLVNNANKFCKDHTIEKETERMILKVKEKWPLLR